MTLRKTVPIAFAASAAAVLTAGSANALSITNTWFADAPTVAGNASVDAARAGFTAAADAVYVEDFESASDGAAVDAVFPDFGGMLPSSMVTYAGTPYINDGPVNGQEAVSPTQYVHMFARSASAAQSNVFDSFDIFFDGAGTTLFAFDAVDIGDFGGTLEVTLLDAFGLSTGVGFTVIDTDNGNLSFRGFETDDPFFGVLFTAAGGPITSKGDGYALDDFRFGVAPGGAVVPLPGAGLLLLSGVFGIAGLRRFGRTATA